MTEAVTSSVIPGVAEPQSLGWSSAVAILKQASKQWHTMLKDTLLMLTFRKAYFQAAITKIYQWTMHNLWKKYCMKTSLLLCFQVQNLYQ